MSDPVRGSFLAFLLNESDLLFVLKSVAVRKKIKMSGKKAEETSIFSRLWAVGVGALKGVVSIEDQVEKSLQKHKRPFEGWVVKTVVMGLSIFMSLAFLILGVFFVAIDYGGVPRGVVFIFGGLLGLLVLKLMVPSTK